MRTKTKLEQLEKWLNTRQKEPKVFILTSYVDYVGQGYFKNEAEQETYVDWRIDELVEQNRGQPTQIIYSLDHKDIEEHLEAFKKSQL